MKLSKNDLYYLCQSAIDAATKAGKYIAQFNTNTLEVNTKIAGESYASQVVTEVDIKSQKIILEILKPTIETYDLALLTEEITDDKSRLIKDYFWCIDPLDGTLSFVRQTSGYAVSIALVSRKGIPVIGVVYDVVEQNVYHAIYNEGAYKNGQPIKIQSGKTFHFILNGSLKQHADFDKLIEQIKLLAFQLGYSEPINIYNGGAVMNALWVLERAPALYLKLPKTELGGGSLWDYAATACIFHELGVSATDITGQLLDLNRADSTFMNHRGVLYASDKLLAKQIMEIF